MMPIEKTGAFRVAHTTKPKALFRVMLLLAALWLGPWGGITRAYAHPILQTLVEVRVAPDRVRLHLVLPSSELVFALIEEGRIARSPPGFLRYPDAPAAMVRAYLMGHLSAQGADGTAYRLALRSLAAPDPRLPDGDPAKDWQADIDLIPDHGPIGPVRLTYGAITREVINHDALFSLVADWQGGILPGHPRLIGQIQRGEHTITIAPGAGQSWRSWVQMVELGLWHIAEGADHQAFLLTLLLTAGLVPLGRGWALAGGLRPAVVDTLWRVSAFTLGHSVSLLVTSLGWLPAGGQGIEVVIAVSVGLSAIHAIVPLYAGRESWIAVFFGLIHGMAFATAIRDMALPMGQTVAATLAFNVGIELAQLVLVAVALPVLLVVRMKTAMERLLRVGLAAVAIGLSALWIAQRV